MAEPTENPATAGESARSPFDTSVDTGAQTLAAADSEPVEPAKASRELAAQAPPRLRLLLLLCVATVVVIVDVVSKLLVVANMVEGDTPVKLIPSVLDLQLTRNPGAAFGFAAGATVIFTVVAAAVVVFIVRAARKLGSVGWAWALGLLLGGALGNLGDRIFRAPGPLRGHVVDWIHLHHWPIFNIADSGVVIGGILAVLLSMRGIRLDGTRAEAAQKSAGHAAK